MFNFYKIEECRECGHDHLSNGLKICHSCQSAMRTPEWQSAKNLAEILIAMAQIDIDQNLRDIL